jgi:hypothetical protein
MKWISTTDRQYEIYKVSILSSIIWYHFWSGFSSRDHITTDNIIFNSFRSNDRISVKRLRGTAMHRPRISNTTLLPNRFWAIIRGRIQYAHSESFSEVRLRPFTTYILLSFFNSVNQIHTIPFPENQNRRTDNMIYQSKWETFHANSINNNNANAFHTKEAIKTKFKMQ